MAEWRRMLIGKGPKPTHMHTHTLSQPLVYASQTTHVCLFPLHSLVATVDKLETTKLGKGEQNKSMTACKQPRGS